jgi:hypothetical protein
MFKRIHLDAYTVVFAIIALAGLITWMLVTFNPVR